jgi:DNA repair exonuclease SbcCD ATPase subunit
MNAILAADLGDTPADFVKWGLVLISFLISNYVMLRRAQGTRESPVHVQSPLEVQEKVQYADKAEMERELRDIESKVESMARENLRAHNAVQQQVQNVMSKGEERAERILKALHDMETRLTTATLAEIKDLHQRINPLSGKVEAHSASLRAIEARLPSGNLVGK